MSQAGALVSATLSCTFSVPPIWLCSTRALLPVLAPGTHPCDGHRHDGGLCFPLPPADQGKECCCCHESPDILSSCHSICCTECCITPCAFEKPPALSFLPPTPCRQWRRPAPARRSAWRRWQMSASATSGWSGCLRARLSSGSAGASMSTLPSAAAWGSGRHRLKGMGIAWPRQVVFCMVLLTRQWASELTS